MARGVCSRAHLWHSWLARVQKSTDLSREPISLTLEPSSLSLTQTATPVALVNVTVLRRFGKGPQSVFPTSVSAGQMSALRSRWAGHFCSRWSTVTGGVLHGHSAERLTWDLMNMRYLSLLWYVLNLYIKN